jgi:hypothetical protein
MSTPTIPDLVTFRELHGKWTSAGRAAIVDLINARHRVRMIEAINGRANLEFALDRQQPWNEKAQELLDAGRWAGHTLIEGCVTELAETRAYRDQLEADLNARTSERDAALAEVERLKLDNGILNGRLIERTDCLLTRQRESLDEARKARSIARRALEYIDSLADLLTQLSKDRRYTSKDREAVAKCADRVRENANVIRSDLAAAGL